MNRRCCTGDGKSGSRVLKENSIDSLDLMSVFLLVEEQLGIKFNEEEAGQIDSAMQMVEKLNAR